MNTINIPDILDIVQKVMGFHFPKHFLNISKYLDRQVVLKTSGNITRIKKNNIAQTSLLPFLHQPVD